MIYFLIVITQLFLHHPYLPSWVLILIVSCLEQIISGLYVIELQDRWVCCTRPNINQFSTIYKRHIRSQMEYCSPLWNETGQTVLGRFTKSCNNIDKWVSTLTNLNECCFSECTEQVFLWSLLGELQYMEQLFSIVKFDNALKIMQKYLNSVSIT